MKRQLATLALAAGLAAAGGQALAQKDILKLGIESVCHEGLIGQGRTADGGTVHRKVEARLIVAARTANHAVLDVVQASLRAQQGEETLFPGT